MREAAINANFYGNITSECLPFLEQQVLVFNVYEKRKNQLNMLRASIQETEVGQFVSGKCHAISGVFPKTTDFVYPTEIVKSRIVAKNNDDGSEMEVFAEFIDHCRGKINYYY